VNVSETASSGELLLSLSMLVPTWWTVVFGYGHAIGYSRMARLRLDSSPAFLVTREGKKADTSDTERFVIPNSHGHVSTAERLCFQPPY